jgi:hypothetical protein
MGLCVSQDEDMLPESAILDKNKKCKEAGDTRIDDSGDEKIENEIEALKKEKSSNNLENELCYQNNIEQEKLTDEKIITTETELKTEAEEDPVVKEGRKEKNKEEQETVAEEQIQQNEETEKQEFTSINFDLQIPELQFSKENSSVDIYQTDFPPITTPEENVFESSLGNLKSTPTPESNKYSFSHHDDDELEQTLTFLSQSQSDKSEELHTSKT